MRKIANASQMTEQEWLKYRLLGIGGSDVATIFGLNMYKSPIRLYMEKIEELEPEKVDNEYVEMGKELEPVLRKLFTKRTGIKAVKNNFILQHDEHEFMLANLDGEVIEEGRGRGVLEIKTTSEWNADQWSTDTIPKQYMLQVQHYLAVTGYTYGYICVLIGGNKFKIYPFERDNELIDEIIIPTLAKFWDHVERKEPVDVVGHKDENDLFNRIYTPDTIVEDVVQLPYESIKFLEDLDNIKLQEKEVKETKMFIENRLKDLVKNHDKAYVVDELGNEYNISYKYNKSTPKFDVDAFKEAHPEIYEQFLVDKKPVRKFTTKFKELKY